MASPAYYEMAPLVIGDTWKGLSNITIRESGATDWYNLVSAKMQFRKEKARGGTALDEISTANSGILIENSGTTLWSLSIPAQSLNVIVGDIYYDLETINSSGQKFTYLEGILPVLQDVTR